MKKILILILIVCSIEGYGQTIMKPNGSNTPANINDAISLPAIASGTDTYTTTIIGATLSSKHEAYTIEFTNANTGSATLNISNGSNPLGAITLKKYSSGSLVNLSSGDISAGQSIRFRYNGTNFVMEGGSGSGGGGGDLLAANNLSDLASASTARTNLGLGTLATQNGTSPSSTIVGTSDTQTLTNKTIAAGSNTISGLTNSNLSGTAAISNANLANSSITIAGNSTSLGGSVTQDNITGLSSTGLVQRTGANTLSTTTAPTITGTNITSIPESGVTNLTTDLALKGNKAMAPNIQTTNYTLVLTDADVKQVIANSASNINFTVPPNSSVAYPVGTLITLGTINTGGFTLVPGSGVTLTPPAGGNLLDAGQGQPVQIYQRATDVWDVWNGSTPIVPGAFTKTDDTNVTATLGGSPTTALLQPMSFTLGWTGTLSTARGGTGGTAGAWPLTGTGTLSGPVTMAGTSTNILKYSFPSLGTTITDGAGLWFQNSTAAAAGAQQRSPGIVWEGQGWKTTATAASQTVKWRADVLPVQGTNNPTGNLQFTSEVNGSATGGLLTLASDGAKLTTSANGLKILTNSSTFGGLSFDANSPSANTINVGNNGFTITNTASLNNPVDAFLINSAAATNTTGNTNGFRLNIGFAPTSGTGTMNLLSTTSAMAVNQTGGANGVFKVMDFNHTYTAAGSDVTFIDYRPTVTSITGNHYGIRIQSIANSAFSTTTAPTAKVFIGAGTATAGTAPLKFTSGTNLTTPEDGAIEYNGTDLQLDVSTTRYILPKTLTGSAALDFPSTAGGTNSDLTITLTGAALGDVVLLGVPNGAVFANSCYTAWVSAANTVTVRFNNYDTITARDPSSQTFKISDIK
ncbi:MAG TPA: hypothetical protein VL443_18160 [Cyclobacteriaceae bacterium]|nr:hypothetical protein [Cyclobacteriaceae bacterium]